MYNKVVTTLVVIALIAVLGGAGHAQYYTRTYGAPAYTFGSSAYANSYYIGQSSAFNVNYAGQFRGPIFQPTQRTPSSFNFAYMGQSYAPVFAPAARSPSTINFNFQSMNFAPTFPASTGAPSTINLNFRPINIAPMLPAPRDYSSSQIALNLAPRQIPLPAPSSYFASSYSYNFRSPYFVAVPIYATPSRALFNTEFAYSSYIGPYFGPYWAN